MKFTPLHPLFVAEAEGVDLARPLDAADVEAIVRALDRYGVLLFRGQTLDDKAQVAFSERLGPVAFSRQIDRPGQRLRVDPQIADISNLDIDGEIMDGANRRRLDALANRLWHTDHSFRRVPSTYSLLSAHIVPSAGGETEFADMRAAYDALDDDTRAEIDGLVCEHSLIYSRGQLGFADDLTDEERRNFTPVRQALVRRHSVTGRKSLYLSSHAGQIVGWPIPEARLFLRDLIEHATRERFVYSHKWRKHDLVIWDNRQTMHRVRAYKDTSEVRDMRRTTVAGDGETAEQVAA